MKKLAAALIASMFALGAFAQAPTAPMAGASTPAKGKHVAKHKAAKPAKAAASKSM